MAEWVRWQTNFCVAQKVEGSSPLAAELFLPPKEKQNFLQIRFFLEIFHKNTYLGVKNHEESEFYVKKIHRLIKNTLRLFTLKNWVFKKSILECF